MASLHPYPFGALVRRMFRELQSRRSVFDLPADAFAQPEGGTDLEIAFHGQRASTPFGPAAGPHSQLAQNIVLSWLAGARVIELKTVQVRDRLEIPRPCIDARTVGFNVEWSQELSLQESIGEYVKASMMIRMLAASGQLPWARGFDDTLFDVSIGYDLAGITSDPIRGFLDTMLDAGATIDRLRREIPDECRALAALDYPPRIASSVTLSTFHGCPPGEIARILEFLLRDVGVDATLKLNPTLLGPIEVRRLMHEVLGYTDIRVPDSAFAGDLTWDGLTDIVARAEAIAAAEGRHFGLKFCNTLVVENDGDFLPPSEPVKYLSGPPLHVLAIELVRRCRRQFGWQLPVSFSGGIDRVNFPDAVALGLAPVTACTDLLKPGGYTRGHRYLQELRRRMDGVSARRVPEFILGAYGLEAEALARTPLGSAARAQALRAFAAGRDLRDSLAGPIFTAWVGEAAALNTERYAEAVQADARYARARHARGPRKVGRALARFDCLTCDKCVPVCPNDAIFPFEGEPAVLHVIKAWREPGGGDPPAWQHRVDGAITVLKPRQFGSFADLCNDCGNCDVFCPEDGGPYHVKPRFYGSLAGWEADAPRDGFYVGRHDGGSWVLGRFDGREYLVHVGGDRALFTGDGFAVAFDPAHPLESLDGDASGEVDLTYYFIMDYLRRAVLSPAAVNYINCVN